VQSTNRMAHTGTYLGQAEIIYPHYYLQQIFCMRVKWAACAQHWLVSSFMQPEFPTIKRWVFLYWVQKLSPAGAALGDGLPR